MKAKLTKRNIIFLLIIAILIIPQTRQPLQILLHKGLSYINQSSLIDKAERVPINYPNWKLKSDNNRVLTFSDTKGKVVFINFWATWCPPCIAEMPSLQLLYNDYNDKVEFLFVTNDDFNVVAQFKNKKNFNFEVFKSLNEIPKELYTRSIPRTFIINKQGEIVIDESGAIDWNSETVRNQLNDLLIE
ncbi:TlpA disulfide reductase family protein [uncultured Winogradskyella sp.]|uniref:TlpA family protein disulfide reductase n=1 Tax=uncultured Winogradskyella sp. TaxID=395353 RepID=UPI00262B690F|nr:TlpA disulfide reductase family protein [uncultured Winogradskyella sp.]